MSALRWWGPFPKLNWLSSFTHFESAVGLTSRTNDEHDILSLRILFIRWPLVMSSRWLSGRGTMFWFEKHQIVGSHSLSHNVSLSLSTSPVWNLFQFPDSIPTNEQTFHNLGFGDDRSFSIYKQPAQVRLEYTFSDLGLFSKAPVKKEKTGKEIQEWWIILEAQKR